MNGTRKPGSRGDLDISLACTKLAGDVAKVFHVRAADDGPAEEGRLQDVVTAARGQGTAHEDDIRQREQAAQLADGIEQECTGQLQGALEPGTPHKPDARRVELGRGGVEALRFARSEQQDEARMPGRQLVEGRDHGVVFVYIAGGSGRHGAGGDPDLGGPQTFDEAANRGRGIRLARRNVVFQVAADAHPFGGSAHVEIAPAHGVALHQHRIRTAHHLPEEAAQAAVTR